MSDFVPKEKMGKKARKELDRRQRIFWEHSPVTRTIESRKTYSRKRKTHDRGDELPVMGSFLVLFDR